MNSKLKLNHFRFCFHRTNEEFSQTAVEGRIILFLLKFMYFDVDLTHLNDGPHALIFEPTEVDYLKQIVLAYMTGTDRLVCSFYLIQ